MNIIDSFLTKKEGFTSQMSINHILIVFICSIIFKEYYFESVIKLNIDKKGNISIYSIANNHFASPDLIEISDVNQSTVMNYYYFNETDNVVKLIWKKTNFKDTSFMFSNCYDIVEIDLSHFDFSNITSMAYMFSGCSSLKSINVSNIDINNVNNISYMFSNCFNLTYLDLSNFNTSTVISMEGMFSNCSNLVNLEISNFKASNVIFMNLTFFGCKSLKSLNLSNFDTKNVIDMSQMFMGCSTLESLNLSNFNTSNVRIMNKMFTDCNSLQKLYLRNFDLSQVSQVEYIFFGCNNLFFIDFSQANFGNHKNVNIFNSINYNITICVNNKTEKLKNNTTFPYYINIIQVCNSDVINKNINLHTLKNETFNIPPIDTNNIDNGFNFSSENNGQNDMVKVDKIGITPSIHNQQTNISDNIKDSKVDECCIKLMKHYNISSKEEISIFTKNFIVEGEKVPKILYEFYDSGNNKLDSSRICKGMFKDIPENCSEYTIESLIKNYCTECNEEYNYYPVYVSDNNNSNFKKCYNDKEGYYYDNISKLYKLCYETCQTCEKNGSSSVNNCLKCKKKNPFKYKSNCYEYCHNNTYNESTNEYICLEEPKCLKKEQKLFMNNKSCIDDCSKDKKSYKINKLI